MIDAVDLFFFKNPGNLAVEFVRRCQVMSKGFFNDDARPAFAISIQAHCAKTLDDIRILAGRRRKIKNAIAARPAFLVKLIQQDIEFLISRWIVKIGLQVADTRGEALPHLWIDRLLARELLYGIKILLAHNYDIDQTPPTPFHPTN